MDTSFVGIARKIATPTCVLVGLMAAAHSYAGPARTVRPLSDIQSIARPAAQSGPTDSIARAHRSDRMECFVPTRRSDRME